MEHSSAPSWWPLIRYHGLQIEEPLLEAGFALGLFGPYASRVLTLSRHDGRPWTFRAVDRPSPFVLRADERVLLPNLQRKTHGPLTGLTLTGPDDLSVPVHVRSTIRYRRARTLTGIPLGDIGAVHGHWWIAAPFAQLSAGTVADFASMHASPPATPWRSQVWSVADCQHAADAARDLVDARCWHLDASKVTDDNTMRLFPYIEGLASLEPDVLSISLGLRTRRASLLPLYSAGVDAINYPLRRLEATQIHDLIAPGQPFRDLLWESVQLLSAGSVSLTMWADATSVESTRAAIDELVGLGVVPILIATNQPDISEADWMALEAHRQEALSRSRLGRTLPRTFPRALTEAHRGPGPWHRLRTAWRRLIRLQRQA